MNKLICSNCNQSEFTRVTHDAIECSNCQTEFTLPFLELPEFELPEFAEWSNDVEDWTAPELPELK